MPQPYHVVYLPGDESGVIPDHVVSVIQTDDPRDVALEQIASPGTIAMQLDSETPEELSHELTYLGFTY
jgi:hypothetical protein